MKKLLLLGIGSALAFTMGGVGPAQADAGVHYSTAATAPGLVSNVGADRCAGCHRIHTAQGAVNLLTSATETGMCYTCHGDAAGGSRLNVQSGVGYTNPDKAGTASALRGGGFEKAMIGSGSASKEMYWKTSTNSSGVTTTSLSRQNQMIPPLKVGGAAAVLPTTSSHSTTGASVEAWGNGALGATAVSKSVKLECGSCHNPHGNGNYRILRPIPVDSGTTKTTDALGAATNGVSIPDTDTKTYTTANYWLSGDASVPLTAGGPVVAVGATDGFITNIAQWCSTCHSRYLATSGSRTTPSVDSVYKYRHTSDNASRNCITCHVAHGTNAKADGAASSVVPMPGSATPVGDSRLLRVDNRGMCLMCHNE